VYAIILVYIVIVGGQNVTWTICRPYGWDGTNANCHRTAMSPYVSSGLCSWVAGSSKCSCFYREML